jgi:hypothetical protein
MRKHTVVSTAPIALDFAFWSNIAMILRQSKTVKTGSQKRKSHPERNRLGNVPDSKSSKSATS